VVGYCIGTTDTTTFAKRWREIFTPLVDTKLAPEPGVRCDDPLMERDDIKGFRHAVHNASCSMLQAWPQTLQQYPAHLHIDILPDYQRKGYGTVLMNAFLDAVRSQGAAGVHLDMVRHNVTGRAFYDRIGFQTCPLVMDGGASGQTGVNGIVITLVKDLTRS
jgi:GNAT superfamily N-acetyltransferase